MRRGAWGMKTAIVPLARNGDPRLSSVSVICSNWSLGCDGPTDCGDSGGAGLGGVFEDRREKGGDGKTISRTDVAS